MILRSSCSTREADPGRKAGRCPNGIPDGGSLAVDLECELWGVELVDPCRDEDWDADCCMMDD